MLLSKQRRFWHIHWGWWLLGGVVLLFLGVRWCARGSGDGADTSQLGSGVSVAPDTISSRAGPAVSKTWVEMRNVDLRVAPDAALRVRRLRGEVLRTTGEPPFLDDLKSFAIRITSGSVALTGADLSALLNSYVFNYKGSPLKRLQVHFEGDQIVQKGVMHKGIDLSFEMKASVRLMPNGLVQVHPTRMRILGMNGESVLHIFGLHLDNVLNLRGAHGASIHGDDLYLDPTALIPPPAIVGRLASIRMEGDRMVQDFVRLPADSIFGRVVHPDSSVPNFVYFRGGKLRFSKLLMYDTDLLIVDADPRDPFDLYLVKYTRQLIAGTSRTLEGLGLRVVMPDYHRLPHAS